MIRYVLALSLALVAAPALAQGMGICAPHDDMAKSLRERFGEVPIGVGVIDSRTVLEVYVSAEGRIWTILMTDTAGNACMVAAGTGWEGEAPKPAGEAL